MMATPKNSGNIYRCSLSLYSAKLSDGNSSVWIILVAIARFLPVPRYSLGARCCRA
jgi:hypothetical protein